MKNILDAYGRDLDLNLLRVFAVVAEEGSITLAATRLYVTQPAVSAAMRRLTDFIGAELFSRQGRGVVLTTRGAELAAHGGRLRKNSCACSIRAFRTIPKSSRSKSTSVATTWPYRTRGMLAVSSKISSASRGRFEFPCRLLVT